MLKTAKSLLLFILTFASTITYAQLSEDFNTGLASSYFSGTQTLSSGNWETVAVFRESAGSSRGGSGAAARINDNVSNAYLQSPTITTGVGDITFWYRELNSGGGTIEIQVSVGGGAFSNVTTQAFSGTSYTQFTYTLNESSNDVRVRIVNDNNNGHLIIDDFATTAFSGSVTPDVGFDAATSSVAEGNSGTTVHTFDVTMNVAPAADVTVDVTDAATGDATGAGDDYTFSTATLTFTTGATYPNTQSVSITINGDVDPENDETVDFNLAVTSGTANTGTTAHTLTITSEELPVIPDVGFDATTSSVAEGNSGTTVHTFDVTMDVAPLADVTVDVTDAATGDATGAGDDYTFSTATLTFTTGATYPNTQSVSITVNGDVDLENDETVDFNLAVTSGTANTLTTAHTLTITSEEIPVTPVALLEWEFNGNSGSETTVTSYTFGPNISSTAPSGVVSRGSGVVAANNGGRFNANNWNTTSLASAVSNDDYMEFTIDVAPGFSMDLTSIAFNWDNSSSGADIVEVRSSVDGYTATLGNISNPGAGETVTLTGFTAITTPTTFRFYGYGASSTGGTAGFEGVGDDLEIFGYTQPAAAVPNITVVGGPLNFGTETVGATSVEQTFTVEGSTLTDPIIVTAPAGYGLSKTPGGPYTSSLSYALSSGSVATSTVYVVFQPVAITNYAGTITAASTGATTQNVAVDGDGSGSTLSTVSAVASSESATISSITNGTISTVGDGAQVWQFDLFDGDGTNNDADALPTVYNSLVIGSAAGNDIADFSTAIADVEFFDGSNTLISATVTVAASSITFTPTTAISVADGAASSERISMRITLTNPLGAGAADGDNFAFQIQQSDVTVGSLATSSQLAAFADQLSDNTQNAIDVLATQLVLISSPATASVSDDFTVSVAAQDANGNIDVDNTIAVTLSKTSGPGTLTATTLSRNLVAGITSWTDVQNNLVGLIDLQVASALNNVTASVTIDNLTYKNFDNFDRVDNSTVGIPSSGGAVSWVENEGGTSCSPSADIIRVNSGVLELSNCNLGNFGSCGTSNNKQISYDMTGQYPTIYDNASGVMEWYFNMSTTRSNPSGFGSGNYGMAFILGSSELDFNSGTAQGYAVIVGNSGTTDPIRLVRFNGQPGNPSFLITDTGDGSDVNGNDNFSVHVTFDPTSDTWTLQTRDDGGSFADPTTIATPVQSTTDNTYTALDLLYSGLFWAHGASCEEIFTMDNISIPNPAKNIWTGTSVVDNTNWFDATNWTVGVPSPTLEAIIPALAPAYPILSGSVTAEVSDIAIALGATITNATIAGNSPVFEVYGDWINDGSFGNEGDASFIGPAAQTILGTTGFATLNIDNANGVTIDASATVDVYEALELETGALTNSGSLNVKSTAIQTAYVDDFSGGFAGSIAGSINVERFVNNGFGGFSYISSAVTNGSITDWGAGYSITGPNNTFVTPKVTCDPNELDGSSAYGSLFDYVESNVTTCNQAGWRVRSSGAIAQGEGFAGVVPNNTVLDVSGTYATGNITGAITYTRTAGNVSGSTGWNLAGNPYASPLNWADVAAANTNLQGFANLWQASGSYAGTYQSINALVQGEIASGQSFFVEAITNGTISYTNAMRRTGDVGFFKQAKAHESMLTLKVSGNGYDDVTRVAFADNFTTQRDRLYDANKLYSVTGVPTLYTETTVGLLQSINALPNSGSVVTVPVGFKAGADGNFTFDAANMDGFAPSAIVLLEDKTTGTFTNLMDVTTYSFNSTVNDAEDRFVLHFVPAATIASTKADCDGLNGTLNINFGLYTVGTATIAWDNVSIVDDNNTTVFTAANVNGLIALPQLDGGEYTVTYTLGGYVATEQIMIDAATTVDAAITADKQVAATGEAIEFNATMNGATNYYWNMGNGASISGTTAPTYTYFDAGVYDVTLIAENDECSTTSTTTVEVMKVSTGIAELLEGGVAIYSFDNTIRIAFAGTQADEEVTIRVMDMLGREVVRKTTRTNGNFDIVPEGAQQAYYVVQVTGANTGVSGKVFVK